MLHAIIWKVANKVVTFAQGKHYEFGSAGAVYSIEESYGPQNLLVFILLKASKSADAKIDVFMVCALTAPMLRHSLLVAPNGCNKLKILT
jgi:hypothetical protein